MPDSFLVSNGQSITSFVGPDAVALHSAITLRAAIQLYAKTKIIPYRGMTITKMLNSASHLTGHKYKRTEIPRACADLTIWIETMRSALPIQQR